MQQKSSTKTVKKELPQKVYVYVEHGNGNDWWFIAEPTPEECAEKGEKRLIGVYELKEKLFVSLEVKTELTVKKA